MKNHTTSLLGIGALAISLMGTVACGGPEFGETPEFEAPEFEVGNTAKALQGDSCWVPNGGHKCSTDLVFGTEAIAICTVPGQGTSGTWCLLEAYYDGRTVNATVCSLNGEEGCIATLNTDEVVEFKATLFLPSGTGTWQEIATVLVD